MLCSTCLVGQYDSYTANLNVEASALDVRVF